MRPLRLLRTFIASLHQLRQEKYARALRALLWMKISALFLTVLNSFYNVLHNESASISTLKSRNKA